MESTGNTFPCSTAGQIDLNLCKELEELQTEAGFWEQQLCLHFLIWKIIRQKSRQYKIGRCGSASLVDS